MKAKTPMKADQVREFLDGLFEGNLHVKRVDSLSKGTMGVIQAAALGVHAIGHGLALATGAVDKHAIKQVDRMLSNQGIDMDEMFGVWIPAMIGERKEAQVVLDWTDFDADKQTMLMLSLVTSHGRATPLAWRTLLKSELKGKIRQIEADLILCLLRNLPDGVRVTLLADRGFDDHEFMGFVKDLCNIDFVIRFRGKTHVEAESGEVRPAKEWVGPGGRAKMLKNAKITTKGFAVATVVCVHDKAMKEPWCLASSLSRVDAQAFIKWYARRWSIEASFRDLKNPMFGLGLEPVRIERCDRRDRMVLIAAFAIVLMTLLGAAGELLKMDWMLKASSTKKRTLSLLRQGYYWHAHTANMPEDRLRPLMEKFGELLQEHAIFKHLYGWV